MRSASVLYPPPEHAPLEVRRAWKDEQRGKSGKLGFAQTQRRESMRSSHSQGSLPNFEIKALCSFLEREGERAGSPDLLELSTAAAIGAVLSTSRRLSIVAELWFSRISSNTSVVGCQPGLICKGGKWGWWLPAGTVEGRRDWKGRQPGPNRSVQSMVWLPCGPTIIQLFKTLLNAQGGAWHENGERRLFFEGAKVLECHVSELMRKLRKEAPALSVGRIERWLDGALFRETLHDHAVTHLITARESRWDRAGGSYVNLSLPHAAQLYTKATARIDRHDQRLSIPPELTDLSVGSPFVPLDQRLRRFANAQTEILKDRGRGKRLDIVRLHDAMTRYTFVLVALGSGARRLGVVPTSRQIDSRSGFTAIEDKRENRPDLPSGYRRRLMWLSDEARQQIRYYEDHLRALRTRTTDDDLLFTSGSPDQLPLLTLNHRSEGMAQVEKLTPRQLLKNLTYYGLRAEKNAWRHLARSHLHGRCPGEYVRAFMGHWEQGLEPWSRDSALDPQDYAHALRKVMPTFLRDLGFEPIPGLR